MAEKLESGNAVLQTILASEGNRALKLLQQRQKRQKELEVARQEIEGETKKRRLHKIDEKYHGSTTEALEEQFRLQTVGLVSADEFRERRKRIEELKEQIEEAEEPVAKSSVGGRNKSRAKLSFQVDDVEDDEVSEVSSYGTSAVKKKFLGKDPAANTSFLADAGREAKMQAEQDRLMKEYHDMSQKEKQELLEVTYSYWDGLGHRRSIRVKKGTTIGQFLNECRVSLEQDFPELKSIPNDHLLYVKEDLILPHHVTFHELIRNKTRGKSGPLFNFDVHDDVRPQGDIRIEKDESHAGKIVDRKWYERNRHIFPASRWEMYDPNKTYEKYTIRGDTDFSQNL